jgi:hypothetical protein
MNLRKLIFTNCDSYKAGKKITPKGVMVHSTGANNPSLSRYVGPDDGLLGENKHNNHWNMPKVGASVHAFIGKLKDGSVATYQVLPFNYRAGHCASGKNGSGNNTHLAFEICEDGLTDPVYFGKVYQEAVEFTAYLCEEFNLDPMADGVVIDHREGHKRGIASNHGDVKHWFTKHGKSMDTFRADVKALLDGEKKPVENKEGLCTVEIKVLKKGAKGSEVTAMQTLLIGYGFSCGSYGADGSFGAATDNALRAFQKANGLSVDGCCGPKSWGKLLGVSA